MEPIHTVRLRPGEQDRLLAGHPWIYQNELEGWPPDAAPGDLVDLHDSQGHFLGRGYLNPRTTLAVRVLARGRVPVDQEFFLARIRQAMALRERFMGDRVAYRVVHGEADGLPGLRGVGSVTAAGMIRRHGDIAGVLRERELSDSDRAYLEVLANQPDYAQVFLVESAAAGPAAIERRIHVQGRYVDLLRTWYGNACRELGDEARWGEYTSVLLKEVTRVNSIIEMLLDVGRPVTLRVVPLNVHQLLERVALLLEEEAASRRITFVRRYDPSLPPILADEDRIMQVFHNLVRNAIEAMPGGGRLTLVTRLSMNPLFAKVDLGQGQRSMAEIQIADEGAGISEETRAKLFTPFFTTKERGLGLGLALCHRIVDEHGGAIQVTSEPGRGTAMSCFLPIAR